MSDETADANTDLHSFQLFLFTSDRLVVNYQHLKISILLAYAYVYNVNLLNMYVIVDDR
jgi:hypothetical protein